jgi:phosphopantothenoylcysteine synthetase/decarboxylase
VHVSKQRISPKRAKDFARLAGEVGRLAPSLTTITRKKSRLPPAFMPPATRRHWQHAASNDARARIRDNSSR